MIPKEIDKITEFDLQALIENSVMEGKTIEYKHELPGNSDSDKKEFLADVSSSANAAGGDLIYGISSDNSTGLPKSLDGIDCQNIDKEISRLDNMLRDGIEPRLSSCHVQGFALSSGKYAVVIRVSKSWLSPHRVTFKGHDRFYSRSSNGKYSLDVLELRTAFSLSETITERIRRFRENRISKILADETPVPLRSSPRIVFHLIPHASFNPAHNFDLTKINSWQTKIPPLYVQGWNHRLNLDGLLTYSGAAQGKLHSYVQVFKNGIIEAVESAMLGINAKEGIPSVLYERELIRSLNSFLIFYKELGVELPVFVFLSFLGVQGYSLAVDPSRFWNLDVYTIDRDIVNLPEVQIESYEQQAQGVLKPLFDLVWNACGYERCFNYDNNGKWVGH